MKNKRAEMVFNNYRDFKGYTVATPALVYSGIYWDSADETRLLPISVGIGRLRARDVLLLPICDEIVIIKSVSYKHNTIDLYSRGFGSTSPYRQGQRSLIIKIMGHFTKKEVDRAYTKIGGKKK